MEKTRWYMVDNFGTVLCPEDLYTMSEIAAMEQEARNNGYRIQCAVATYPCNYTVVRNVKEDEDTIAFLTTDFLHLLSENELLILLMILKKKIGKSNQYSKGYDYIMNFLDVQRAIPKWDLEDELISAIRREMKK